MSDIEYSWDEIKRKKTLKERGLDFEHMTEFDWETSILMEDIRRLYPETRYVSTGFLDGELVICAWCYRDATTRIISLRKANKRERTRYEKATSTFD